MLLLAAWLANHRLQSPGTRPPDEEVPLALPDTPEGNYARRLVEASVKDGGGFPEPIRVRDLLDAFAAGDKTQTGKLVIVVGTVDKVDGEYVDLAMEKPGRLISCRATFAKHDATLATLKPGDVVTVAGDCQGATGATVQLVDCVLVTDAFMAKASELLAGLGKNHGK
jgi:tRNA_anti-like